MTKVQKHFHLEVPIDDAMLARIADAHAVYGIERIKLGPGHQDLMVEYDASRLRLAEVESALQRAGVPLTPAV